MLFVLAVAPIVILLLFIFIKDRYEKEPLALLGLGVFFGLFLVAPVLLNDKILLQYPLNEQFPHVFQAFITSSGNEELLKFIILFFLIYKNHNFNEPVDGIVYAVFISLGFAMGENIIYVFHRELGGLDTAVMRGFTSVPAHMMFGINMGYYFAKWRYLKEGTVFLFLALLSPWIFHGLYNFILLKENPGVMVLFALYFAFLAVLSITRFLRHLRLSPFKTLKK